MNLYLSYSDPAYLLQETPSTAGGSIVAGMTVDYVYGPRDNRILEDGVLALTFEAAVVGAMTIYPKVYFGAPVTENLVFEGTSRNLPEGGTTLQWTVSIPVLGITEDGITLRFVTTEETTDETSVLTVGESYLDIPLYEGSRESVDVWTEDTFRLFLIEEYFFVWTTTDVKERVDLGLWSRDRFSSNEELGVYTTDRLLSEEEINVFSTTRVFLPDQPNYISNLYMNDGSNDFVLHDGLRISRNGGWLEESYGREVSLAHPPEREVSPGIFDMRAKTANSFLRVVDLVEFRGDPPGKNVEVYYPADSYSGTYVYRDGEWQLPVDYSGTHTIQYPFDIPLEREGVRHVFFMILHREDSSYLTAKMGGIEGSHLTRQKINSTDTAEVFYWNQATVPINISLRIRNETGEVPGFRGIKAATLYSR